MTVVLIAVWICVWKLTFVECEDDTHQIKHCTMMMLEGIEQLRHPGMTWWIGVNEDTKRFRLSQDDNEWLKNFDKRPHHMSCHYEALNYPFCCVHRSRYSQCFSVGRTTPRNCPFPRESRPHLKHGFLAPLESAPERHLKRFSYFCTVHQCEPDTETTLCVTSVTIGHIYAMHVIWINPCLPWQWRLNRWVVFVVCFAGDGWQWATAGRHCRTCTACISASRASGTRTRCAGNSLCLLTCTLPNISNFCDHLVIAVPVPSQKCRHQSFCIFWRQSEFLTYLLLCWTVS